MAVSRQGSGVDRCLILMLGKKPSSRWQVAIRYSSRTAGEKMNMYLGCMNISFRGRECFIGESEYVSLQIWCSWPGGQLAEYRRDRIGRE